MQGKERTFTPEVEKVWNKDYQCEYYRGVIIDGEDNIVERCTRTHASYDAALDEAKKKTIVIKRKWVFYNDLMEYIHNYAICMTNHATILNFFLICGVMIN